MVNSVRFPIIFVLIMLPKCSNVMKLFSECNSTFKIQFIASYTKNCSDGWLDYQDYCYLFHHVTATLQGQSMSDSLLSCQQYGGSLLSVKDKAESDFIAKQFNNDQIRRQHFWIGKRTIVFIYKFLD